MASGDLGLTNGESTPSWSISVALTLSLTITGSPQLMASNTARPQL